ncbi:MAG: signal peptidase II [Microthrixaceae bacterium]
MAVAEDDAPRSSDGLDERPEADPGSATVVAPATHSVAARSAVGAAVVLAVFVVDRLSKAWALDTLEPGVTKDFLGPLKLVLAFNDGSAFSLGSGSGPIIGVLALVIVGVVIWAGRHYRSWPAVVIQGLVVGGAVGNLADRVLRAEDGWFSGSVVDFLRLPNWPIFNVADMAITGGALALVFLIGRDRGEA